ncbi:MAG: hypothetical protein MAG795_00833 [Candidatus Woesearchaeota archaeon]|nr:hypothetical protein [Candidatus Woesearchaeota archaeon]
MINRAKNFKYYFSESQTYYSEEHVKGLIKPSWQGYFPNLFNYMIREIIGVVKYLNEPEKRKVYLVVLNYMIESLEFMVSVMDAQIAALKESDILALSPEKQKEIGQVIRRFTIFVIGPISKPTEELRKILKVVDLLKEPYPNTYKQIISVISRIRKKGERFNRIFLGRYGDYSNTWRSTIDSKSTDLMRKWESITYLKIDL